MNRKKGIPIPKAKSERIKAEDHLSFGNKKAHTDIPVATNTTTMAHIRSHLGIIILFLSCTSPLCSLLFLVIVIDLYSHPTINTQISYLSIFLYCGGFKTDGKMQSNDE